MSRQSAHQCLGGLRGLDFVHEGLVVWHQFAIDEVAVIVLLNNLFDAFPCYSFNVVHLLTNNEFSVPAIFIQFQHGSGQLCRSHRRNLRRWASLSLATTEYKQS